MTSLAVDGGHVGLVAVFAGGRGEVVEPLDLLCGQLEGVGCGVLLDVGDALGVGDGGDVVSALGGLTIFTYTAEPGSRSHEALKLLGSWAATVDPAEPASATNQS